MKYDLNSAIKTMNSLGASATPFLFVTDFELENIHIIRDEDFFNENFTFKINDLKSYGAPCDPAILPEFNFIPVPYNRYRHGFEVVQRNIMHGNSYLLNLTFASEIRTDLALRQVYGNSHAKYKLLWKDQFVVFSPETFIKIRDNRIFSFPMKGTIDASLPNAMMILTNDRKELAEHYTIVDLIRNDLNLVAKNVKVERFRYFETIISNRKTLLQTSSEISGLLDTSWRSEIGSLLFKLLPAGSVSGAPKPKTIEIIREAENGPRGFYTGVFGYFDGEELDSGVMIRFLEKSGDKLFFRSGGGITSLSRCDEEYEELKNKIYVPIV
jgi:para-aminobenzoate synthetase component 1